MSILLPNISIQPLLIPIRNTPAGLLSPAQVPPRSLMAQLNWINDYGGGSANPNVNVLVSVTAGGAQQPIDQIRSVKIDNLGNAAPVYVYFLDTTDTIVAPPNTIVWEPVVTNAKIANVICEGLVDGIVANTKVYFCNFFVPPYVNAEINQSAPQWLASPNGGGLLGAALQSLTVTNRGVYTAVPAITIGPPLVGGTQATATITLQAINFFPGVVASDLFAINPVGQNLNFANGVQCQISTVAGDALHGWRVTGVQLTNAGSIAAGAAPATMVGNNPAGNVTASFMWGLGVPTLTNPGAGYFAPPSIGAGAGGGVVVATLQALPAGTSLRSNFGTPALGDLEAKVSFALTAGNTVSLVNATANFIYVTALYVYAYNMTAGGNSKVQIIDKSTLASFWEVEFRAIGDNLLVFSQTGLGFRWAGTNGFETFFTSGSPEAGARCVVKMSYTSNPH